jgi:protein SCO1/2
VHSPGTELLQSLVSTNLTRVQEAFAGDPTVHILSHTIVPEFDTVDVLNRYGRVNNVNPEMWHLVTGPKDDIFDMARTSYLVDLDKTVTSGYAHTENLVIIDQNGHIRGVYNGTLPFDVENMISEIDALQNKNRVTI